MKKVWRYKAFISKAIIITMVVAVFSLQVQTANAAALTSVKDTLTTIAQSGLADHTVTWTLPATVTFAAGDKAKVDFPANFVTSTESGWVAGDFTFNDGTSRTILAVGAAPACSAGANNVTVTINSTNDTFEITACSGYSASGAAATVTFTIDGSATDGTLTNPSSPEVSVVSIVGDDKGNGYGSDDDTGSLAIPIISDDSVNVTATVDPTLTFSISDTTISFGTLSASAARYATGDGTSTNSDPANGAHNMQIATNAVSGYAITYSGATLTHSNTVATISAATVSNSATGTTGTEQFAISFDETTTDTENIITATYDYDDGPDWKFVAGSAQQVVSEAGATDTETIEVHYLANIAGSTEAGTYTTDVTYVATGTF